LPEVEPGGWLPVHAVDWHVSVRSLAYLGA
jgi:hypothetical protein